MKSKFQSFALFIWMGQFSIWFENMQRSPKFKYTDVFSFSSKTTRTLETLCRDWHKNWQPTYCQESTRLCQIPKNTQYSEGSSNFSLLIFFEHNAYKQPVNFHHSIAFILSFYCFSLSRYLGLIAVHDF